MAPLSPIDELSWSEEILEVAREYFNCTIDVFRPGEAGAYDPATDSFTGGTTGTPLISDRPARAQHIRLPLEQAGAHEWSTKRRYRFQIEILDGDPVITKGAIVRVKSGGRDPVLTQFAFEVASASNSSHAALRTIETLSEFGVVPDA